MTFQTTPKPSWETVLISVTYWSKVVEPLILILLSLFYLEFKNMVNVISLFVRWKTQRNWKGFLWKQLLHLLQSHLKRKGASKGNLFVVYESHPSWHRPLHRPLHHDQHMFERNFFKLVSFITMLENSEYSILLSFGIKRVIVTLNLRDSSLSLPKTIATKAYEQLIDKIDKNEWISSDSSTHRLKESVWGTWITISDWW